MEEEKKSKETRAKSVSMKVTEIEYTDQQFFTREKWANSLDFLMVCTGFAVGLGNVWRFPYLCYKNGGGAFLIPYFISVAIVGIPMFYLEIAIGQYMGKGGLQAWNIVPLFQGIGLATGMIVFYLNCYYNIILAWAFYYFFASFTSELPWQHCGHPWNTDNCLEFHRKGNDTSMSNKTYVDPVIEYWENKVLEISDGIDKPGKIKWDLTLCLLLAWVIVYASICKGIKSSGKVVYFTATTPYFFMIILLVRNAMLDGAKEGVKYYLAPNITKLWEVEVWVDAGTQIFFSCSVGLGTLTALGSYNTFTYNSYRDSVIFNCINSGTSFLAGFIVFSCLGFMAKQQQRSIVEIAESGPGLAFIAYPKAVAQMPVAPLWSACFFMMLLLLGLDSQFAGVEGIVTAFVDQYPKILRRGYNREIFMAVCCVVMFVIGLSMVTEGGMYVFQIFDNYTGSRIILLIGFLELFAISYVYGVNRFHDNVMMMIGNSWMIYTLPYLIVCWAVLTPAFCLVLFILSAMTYQRITYHRPQGVYNYPDWAIAIGWALSFSSAICIPFVAIFKFVKHGFSIQIFKLLLVPYRLQSHQKRPMDEFELSLYDYERKRKLSSTPQIEIHTLGYDSLASTIPAVSFAASNSRSSSVLY